MAHKALNHLTLLNFLINARSALVSYTPPAHTTQESSFSLPQAVSSLPGMPSVLPLYGLANLHSFIHSSKFASAPFWGAFSRPHPVPTQPRTLWMVFHTNYRNLKKLVAGPALLSGLGAAGAESGFCSLCCPAPNKHKA